MRRLQKGIWLPLLLVLSSCASFGKPKLVILPEGDVPVNITKGQVAPFDGVLMTLGAFDRNFHDCADKLIPPKPN